MAQEWQNKIPVSEADLLNGLRKLGLQPGMNVLVHSSLSALGNVAGGCGAVTGALQQALSPKGTLLLPAFSLYNMAKAAEAFEFDVLRTPSDVGKVPETFRGAPGVARSIHPTHSLSAWGEEREFYLSAPAISGFGSDSAFDLLRRRTGHVLLLGAGFKSCTLIHYVELECHVPYRKFAPFSKCTIIDAGGRRFPCKQGLHFRGEGVHLDLEKGGRIYETQGGPLKRGKVGQAEALLFPVREFVEILGAEMRRDPEMLINHGDTEARRTA